MPNIVILWLLRGLLAALLLFGSEIALWRSPITRGLPEWLLLAAGYLALSAGLLDWLARYRVRDLFAGLLLAGVYGLAHSLYLSPFAMTELNMFYRLVTLALGAHTLLGGAALLLWLGLLHGRVGRGAWLGAVLVGFGWGVWVRWGAGDVTLPAMLMAGAVVVIAAGVLWAASHRAWVSPPDVRLSAPSWLIVVAVLGGHFAVQSDFANIDVLFIVISGVLLAYCWLILWFQKSERGGTLLDGMGERQGLAAGRVLIAALVFLAAGAGGYLFPFAPGGQQREALIGVFSAFGLVWLPTVSLVLGIRTYRRQTRQKQL